LKVNTELKLISIIITKYLLIAVTADISNSLIVFVGQRGGRASKLLLVTSVISPQFLFITNIASPRKFAHGEAHGACGVSRIPTSGYATLIPFNFGDCLFVTRSTHNLRNAPTFHQPLGPTAEKDCAFKRWEMNSEREWAKQQPGGYMTGEREGRKKEEKMEGN